MKTLRQLRIEKGENQSVLADYLKVSVPEISSYENNLSLPALEDMFALEAYYKERINYNEPYSLNEKHQIIQNLIELMQRFPIKAVCKFAADVYRKNQNPEAVIKFYADQATGNAVDPLLPTNIY